MFGSDSGNWRPVPDDRVGSESFWGVHVKTLDLDWSETPAEDFDHCLDFLGQAYKIHFFRSCSDISLFILHVLTVCRSKSSSESISTPRFLAWFVDFRFKDWISLLIFNHPSNGKDMLKPAVCLSTFFFSDLSGQTFWSLLVHRVCPGIISAAWTLHKSLWSWHILNTCCHVILIRLQRQNSTPVWRDGGGAERDWTLLLSPPSQPAWQPSPSSPVVILYSAVNREA